MRPYTIKNAFFESGMWPVDTKAGIKKMRQYTRSTQENNQKNKHKANSPTALPVPEHPICQAENEMTKWIDRNPRTWSSPS